MSQPGIRRPKTYNPTPSLSPIDSLKSRVKDLEAKVLELESEIAKLKDQNQTESTSKSDNG